jgi:hypothetical protein
LWQNEGDCWDLLGVRHGRVLIFNRTRHGFLVWDPATGDRHCIAAPPEFNFKGKFICNGAVLCAASEQGHAQHGECHSAPFRLFLIGIGKDERRVFANVYSSQTREWGNPSSTTLLYMDDNAVGINHTMVFVAMAGRVKFTSVHGRKGLRVDRVGTPVWPRSRAERRVCARSSQTGQREAELVVLCDNIREYVLV